MRALFAIGAVLTASCGLSSTDTGSGQGVQLSEVWTRPTAPGAETTAFYVTITNRSAVVDRVVGVESPHCAMAEFHISAVSDGVMSMSPAEPGDLTVAPGKELTLEPGGMHVMCTGLTEPVMDGDEVELTVRFAQAGAMTVQASAENR